jgi:hypothetical protein
MADALLKTGPHSGVRLTANMAVNEIAKSINCADVLFGRQLGAPARRNNAIALGWRGLGRVGAGLCVNVYAQLRGHKLCRAFGVKGQGFIVQLQHRQVRGPAFEFVGMGANGGQRVIKAAEWQPVATAPRAVIARGVQHRQCDVARVTANGMSDQPAFVQTPANTVPQSAMSFHGGQARAGGSDAVGQAGQCRRIDHLGVIHASTGANARQKRLFVARRCQNRRNQTISQRAAGLWHAIAYVNQRFGHDILICAACFSAPKPVMGDLRS